MECLVWAAWEWTTRYPLFTSRVIQTSVFIKIIATMFKIFQNYTNLVIAYSSKIDGSLGPTGNEEQDRYISLDRERYLKKLGIEKEKFIGLNQVHGDRIEIVNKVVKGNFISNTDALLTNKADLYLSVRTADCLPIYLFDPSSKVVGLIHAGWRGIKKEIIKKTIEKAKRELGLDSGVTLIGVGPSIGPCHFEVKKDVEKEFISYPNEIIKKQGKTFIDLRSIARKQLMEAGIQRENIEISTICTFDDKDYFSFRRDKPRRTEAQIAVIGLLR